MQIRGIFGFTVSMTLFTTNQNFNTHGDPVAVAFTSTTIYKRHGVKTSLVGQGSYVKKHIGSSAIVQKLS